MEPIASAWQRISAWYAANTPAGTLVLAPGATEEELAQFENAIGFPLPQDLRFSFALHNGTLNEGFLLHFGELLSLEANSPSARAVSSVASRGKLGIATGLQSGVHRRPYQAHLVERTSFAADG